ncbi:MAG: hypothetical protein H0W02_18910, partial [Ktedonobacteraceae bacterium]|nr:hypothetical protein [Ktedonobacteraceae bacterium]
AARQGDPQAREAIITGLLVYVERYAQHYYRLVSWNGPHLDCAELIQVGNLTLVERFDHALSKDRPPAALLAAAYGAIRDYHHTYRTLITQPAGPAYHTYGTTSLDQPLNDDSDLTMAETLAAPSPDPGEADQRDYTPLYQAVEALPPAPREVIVRHFGLHETPPETLSEIASTSDSRAREPVNVMANHKIRAMERLRYALNAVYASERPRPQAAFHPTFARVVDVPPEHAERLSEAWERLNAQGQAVTKQTLYREAGVPAYQAEAYIREQRARQKATAPDKYTRVEEAYATLHARGDTISVAQIMAVANVNKSTASAFLRQRHPGAIARPRGDRRQTHFEERAYGTQ